MRRIRVLHLTSVPRGIGGVERLLIDAAPYFDDEEFDVQYVNLFQSADDWEFVNQLRQRTSKCRVIEGARYWELPRVLRKLAAVIESEGIELLHTHMLHATIVGATVAGMLNFSRVLCTRHYGREVYRRPGGPIEWLDNLAVHRAAHVAAVSSAIYDDVVNRVGVPPGRVSIVPNGISLHSFDESQPSPPEWRERWPDALIIGMVGSLAARKGQIDLIDAMALLRHIAPLRLVIVGDGPDRNMLERRAVSRGVSDRVHFAGFRRDIPAVMRSLDIYVHSARHEPFGVAVLEAMAAERAVIATTAGGIPDIVVDRETGFLVAPGSAESIASAVAHLLAHPSEAQSYARRGRSRLEQRFTIERVTADYKRLYRAMLAGASPDASAEGCL